MKIIREKKVGRGRHAIWVTRGNVWVYHEWEDEEEDVVDTSIRGRKQSMAKQEFHRKKEKEKEEQALERRQETSNLIWTLIGRQRQISLCPLLLFFLCGNLCSLFCVSWYPKQGWQNLPFSLFFLHLCCWHIIQTSLEKKRYQDWRQVSSWESFGNFLPFDWFQFSWWLAMKATDEEESLGQNQRQWRKWVSWDARKRILNCNTRYRWNTRLSMTHYCFLVSFSFATHFFRSLLFHLSNWCLSCVLFRSIQLSCLIPLGCATVIFKINKISCWTEAILEMTKIERNMYKSQKRKGKDQRKKKMKDTDVQLTSIGMK